VNAARGHAGAEALFLRDVLLDGALAVDELDAKARAVGLLGPHQRVGDSKSFRRAKKALGIRSVRVGFGVEGQWSWALPTASGTDLVETAADLAPKAPAPVAYADHSRPEQLHAPDQRTTSGRVSAALMHGDQRLSNGPRAQPRLAGPPSASRRCVGASS
jgi:hypothetical protein